MPIALSDRSLDGIDPGTVLRDIANGSGPRSFGWLSWAGNNGVAALVAALTPPGTVSLYRDPDDPQDRRLDVGDRVRGRPGVANAKAVRDALDRLKQLDVTVPTWDAAAGSGSDQTYRVADFALVRLLDYELPGENRITARFLGRRDCTPPADDRIEVQTDEDTPVTATISATDADSARLTFTLTAPEHGSASEPTAPQCTTAGATTTCTALVTYTPAADRNGSDRFTYRASDGTLFSRVVPVEIAVRPVNDAPVAGADDASVRQGETLTTPAAALLADDRPGPADEIGQALTLTDVRATPSTHGTVELTGGSVAYTPDSGFAGTAGFTYTVCDDGTSAGQPDPRCSQGAVAVVVEAGAPPLASDVAVAADEDDPAQIELQASDPDGDPLTFAIVDGPEHGALDPPANAGDRSRTYRPERDFAGTDRFTYTASDGTADSDAATVTITVRPRPDPPRITSQPLTGVVERASYAYDVDARDPDAGDELAFSLTARPAGMSIDPVSGEIAWIASGATAEVTVRVRDRDGLADTQSFTIAVTPDPRPPVAADDEPPGLGAREDEPVAIPSEALLANDSDPDGDPLTIASVSAGADTHGTVARDGDGVAYVPDPDYNGPVTFTYRASDGALPSNSASVRLALAPVNDAPRAIADAESSAAETLTIPLARLTANDSPGPGNEAAQALTVTDVDALPATRGGVRLFAGNAIYTPPPGFTGTDTFAYIVCDDGTTAGTPDPRCDRGTVSVAVTAAPRPPAAQDVAAVADEDTPVPVRLAASDPDGDPVSYSIEGGPAMGTLSPAGEGGADRTYTPDPDTFGEDRFTYRASDGALSSAPATVTIAVREANDPPVAAADGTAVAGRAISFPAADLALNDAAGPVNESSQALTVTRVTLSAATHGTVTLALGTVTYTAQAGFNGDATFGYEVCDDGTTAGVDDPRCDEGEVTLSVTQPPAAPVADDLSVATDEDEPAAVTLSATDPSGDPLKYAIVDPPAGGTISPPGPGAAERTYSPAAQRNGTDSFTYRASDGEADSNVATVTVTVRPVNDPPEATDDERRAARDTPLTFPATDLTANDAPGPPNEARQALEIESVTASAATHGTVRLADGAVTYVPDGGFLGDARFAYRVCDDGQTAGADDPRCANANVAVEVAEAAVEAIAVAPADRTIAGGETVRFTATGTFTDGTTRDVTDDVAWTSSRPAVANVAPGGSARGVEPGTTTITAAKDGASGTASLTVREAELRSIVVEPAVGTILVGQTQGFRATGVLSDGTSTSLSGAVVWSSASPAVASIAADGTALGAGEGTTIVSATRDGVTGTSNLAVRSGVADVGAPTAQIAAPADNTEVTGPENVTGTATDPNFLKYVLAIAPAGETAFTTIDESTEPVSDGVLGRFDPTMLRNDLYTVRLTVHDRGGNSSTDTTVLQVARDQKVGNFSITLQDLDVPLSGIPITINRTYDSRDKGRGDFGVGWRLDVQTLKIRANRVQGTAWQVNRSGGFFPTYSLVPTDAHRVSLSLPDGRVEEFDLVPAPASSVIVPLQFVEAQYRARSGTLGSLRSLDNNGLFVSGGQPGPVTLVDDFDFFTEYDPQTFEYTAPSGAVYVIGKRSGVQSVRDTNGNTLTFGPAGITHSSGVGVAFTRDAQDRITTITDPKGNEHRYAYDANGDLASHVDPAGNRTAYAYNRSHGLIEIRDPRGVQAARNEYDDDGRLVAIVDAEGNRTTYEHDLAGRQEIIRDRRGRTTVYVYDDDGNILRKTDALGQVSTRSYDARGNELTLTDPLGNTTTTEYDARNNVVRRVDATGAVVTRTFNSLNQVLAERDGNGDVTSYSYDARGNLLSKTDPSGAVTTHTYDSRGNALVSRDGAGNEFRYAYDGAGKLVGHTDATGAVSTYANDANANRVSTTTTRTRDDGTISGVVEHTAYDGEDRPVRTVDGVGHVTRTEYDVNGQLSATVDATGGRTSNAYDELGRLARTTFPDGTAETYAHDASANRVAKVDRAGRTTSYAYDGLDRLVSTTHPDGSRETTEYDEAGRIAARTDARGGRSTFGYDGVGRRVRATDPRGATTTYAYDSAGHRIRETDPLGRDTTFAYDDAGRLTRTTFPDGTSRESAYDARGQRVATTDEAGSETRFGYDAVGRLTGVTDALGGITSYGHDELGNLTAITDARGNRTRLAYDDAGRMVKRTLPLGEAETFAHDPRGNVTSHTDFNGDTTTRGYDEMDRLTRETRPEGTTRYTYTASGVRSTVDHRGEQTRYDYDARDRPVRVESPDGSTIDYGYDAAGNRTSLRSAAGTISHDHDAAGNLTAVTDPAGGVTRYGYDLAANQISATLPNATRATYEHDARDRLTRVVHRQADGTIIADHAYTLNATGQRVEAAEGAGRTVRYGYDALDRLVEEDVTDPAAGDRLTGYAYDAVGNRISATAGAQTTTYTYDADDRLLTAGAETFTYDANGNVVGRAGAGDPRTFDYDSANRLIGTTAGADSAQFRYDAAGNRVGVSAGSASRSYLVDAAARLPKVLEERAGDGSLAAHYVFGGDSLVSQRRGGSTSYHHHDALGSTRALTSESGAVTDRYSYDAFGNDAGSTGSTSNDFRFAGEQLEPELGAYYLRARHLDPTTGRFGSLDPLLLGRSEQPLSLHRYLYANADPVNETDPTGMFVASAGFAAAPTITVTTVAVPSYSLILLRVTQVVAQALVQSCAISFALSRVTDVGTNNPCKVNKYPVIYPGLVDTPETTAHIGDAILSHPAWANLTRGTGTGSRRWYGSDPRCAGSSPTSWCDEYPFYTTMQGGPGASLRLVPAAEQRIQAGKLTAFYGKCGLIPNDPFKGSFGVVPSVLATTQSFC